MDRKLKQLETLRDQWRDRAALRREDALHDPIAEVLSRCANDLQRILALPAPQFLSPAEFAARVGTTPQSVTAWCRSGKLAAHRDVTSRWQIPADAQLDRAA